MFGYLDVPAITPWQPHRVLSLKADGLLTESASFCLVKHISNVDLNSRFHIDIIYSKQLFYHFNLPES